MNEPTIAQTVLFPDLVDRPLIATFDQPHASSDGGAILLKAAEDAVSKWKFASGGESREVIEVRFAP